MSVRVLSGDDVRAALKMPDCIEAMDAVLRQLAAGELYLPLRSVVRPPQSTGFVGLMTAHRAGDAPAFGLKAVAIFPDNPSRGLDAHQGVVIVFSGEDGRVRGFVDASAVTAIRTAAVSAVATRALAREGATTLAVLGAGVQAAAHIEAMACVMPLERVRIYSRRPEPAPQLAAATAERYGVDASAAASVEEALRDADVVVTATTAREPIVERGWFAPGAHINAVGSSIPTTRELDGATVAAARLVVDARESTLNESGDLLLAVREGTVAEGVPLVELGEVLSGNAAGRTSPDQLTAFISLGLAVEDLAAAELALRVAAEAGLGAEVPLVIPLDSITRARETLRGERAANTARAPAPRRRPGGDLPQARVPAADRLVQDPRRAQRHGGGAARRAGARRRHGERGQHGPGRGLGCARARRAVHRRRARHRAEDQAGCDRAAGRAHPAGAVRGLVARDRDVAAPRGRGLFRASRAGRRRNGRQRHDRARDPRGPARCRRRARSRGAAAA